MSGYEEKEKDGTIEKQRERAPPLVNGSSSGWLYASRVQVTFQSSRIQLSEVNIGALSVLCVHNSGLYDNFIVFNDGIQQVTTNNLWIDLASFISSWFFRYLMIFQFEAGSYINNNHNGS